MAHSGLGLLPKPLLFLIDSRSVATGRLSSVVEQRFRKPQVLGSSPRGGSTHPCFNSPMTDVSWGFLVGAGAGAGGEYTRALGPQERWYLVRLAPPESWERRAGGEPRRTAESRRSELAESSPSLLPNVRHACDWSRPRISTPAAAVTGWPTFTSGKFDQIATPNTMPRSHPAYRVTRHTAWIPVAGRTSSYMRAAMCPSGSTSVAGKLTAPRPCSVQSGLARDAATTTMCGMRKSARLHRLIRPFALAGAALLLLASGAGAASTPKLANQITDQAGVLGSGKSQVQTALDGLQSGANVQLWLVTISTTGSTSAPDFARATFEANGLGGNDMILLIATNDHRYGWWEVQATGLPAKQIDDLLSSRMDSLLKSGDYAGAVASFATGLGDAVLAAKAPVAKPTAVPATAAPATSNGSGSSDSGSSILWLLIGVILVGGGLIFVYLWLVSRRGNKSSRDEGDTRTGDLARQANQMLLATDDALHEAGQDLGFAQAEFSDEDTAPYAAAIAAAQNELKLAFTVRQKLDDSIPEDQPTKERMYGEIIAHCTAAKTAGDEQAKRRSELRDLEKSAPQALAALPQAIAALQAREPAITAAQKTLAEYAPSSWASVKGNAEEADKRGHFAEQQVAAGNAALAATLPNANAAAHAARAAQEAVAQANQLLDAMEQQAAALKKAGASLADEIAAVEAELAAANKTAQAAAGGASGAGATGGGGGGAGAADLAKAETLLQAAKNQAGAASPDTISRRAHPQTQPWREFATPRPRPRGPRPRLTRCMVPRSRASVRPRTSSPRGATASGRRLARDSPKRSAILRRPKHSRPTT